MCCVHVGMDGNACINGVIGKERVGQYADRPGSGRMWLASNGEGNGGNVAVVDGE